MDGMRLDSKVLKRDKKIAREGNLRTDERYSTSKRVEGKVR